MLYEIDHWIEFSTNKQIHIFHDVAVLAKYFAPAKKEDLEELLETLVAVGQVRLTENGRFAA